MRYWFLSLAIVIFVVTASESQDKKKEPDKKKEIPGKEKDPTPTAPEITEVQGRSFKEWRTDIHDKDPSKREEAMRQILLFGPEKAYDAVPEILAELKKHTALTPVDLSVRVNGTMALNTIFKYKKDPNPKHVKEAITIYRTFLKDNQLLLKIRTVQGLTYYGPACREALPEVVAMASTKDSQTWEARKEAVQVLGMLGFSDKGVPNVVVMGEVLKAVGDGSYQVRIAALNSIARLGQFAPPEQRAPILGRLYSVVDNDPDLHVIITAHLAIMTVEKKVTPKHLNPIINLAKHKDPAVRLLAVQSLA